MPGPLPRRAALACAAATLLLVAPACRRGHEDEPPPRRDQEAVRDTGEKPQQVMDELEIESGSKVADVMAGGGYYTYLLAERVGPQGIVYATGSDAVAARLAEGDLQGRENVRVVEDLEDVPEGTLDAVLVNRAYHLINQPQAGFFPAALRALRPGGRIGVVEVRLGQPTGHDMKTHRMGEQTVREEFETGGFRLVKSSEILANPDDPRTEFMEGKRHLADRLFLIFEKPAGATAAR